MQTLKHTSRQMSVAVAYVAVVLMIAAIPGRTMDLLMIPNTTIQSVGNISVARRVVHHVNGDRILDENESEVVWRGAGMSYLFHTSDYITAWQLHIPEIQKMSLNCVRLAFRFPDSNSGPDEYIAADTLDFEKMDSVLELLKENRIKAILDCHNYADMSGDFGSQKLIRNWVNLAEHYSGDPRIVAYELFNEPYSETWHTSVRTKEDVAKAYQLLTKQVRSVDPWHIVIWQSQPYLPVLETVSDFFEPNTVFTVHRWWHKEDYRFTMWNPSEFSYVNLGYIVEMRQKLHVPFWLGEFGSYYPFNRSNPEYLLTEQTLFRCEEQVVGWNLWMGRVAKEKPFDSYLPIFPLEICNVNLDRHIWHTDLPNLTSFVGSQKGVDRLEPYQAELYHNGDYLELYPGLSIIVITHSKLCNNASETMDIRILNVDERTVIMNEEGTIEHPGDWNIIVFAT